MQVGGRGGEERVWGGGTAGRGHLRLRRVEGGRHVEAPTRRAAVSYVTRLSFTPTCKKGDNGHVEDPWMQGLPAGWRVYWRVLSLATWYLLVSMPMSVGGCTATRDCPPSATRARCASFLPLCDMDDGDAREVRLTKLGRGRGGWHHTGVHLF